ncbi:MAG: hypothetical protein JNG84_14370 [Archangium sp.]|nr:hypothetical protein [Archangium sp.]
MKTMRVGCGVVVAAVLAGCGGASTDCWCSAPTLNGLRTLACGESFCEDTSGYQCDATGRLQLSSVACAPVAPKPMCTPRSCGTACGDVPDDCGGTLHCGGCAAGSRCTNTNVCQPLCAGVTCGAGQRCEPSTGACMTDACTRAGAVCGTIDGTPCGTCPGTSTCASTQRACLERLTTLPTDQFTTSLVQLGGHLVVTHTTSAGNGRDVFDIDLATNGAQRVATDSAWSPLTSDGTRVYWTDTTGVRALTPGSTQLATITGLRRWCNALLPLGQNLYCAYGGSARQIGVSGYGIVRVPLTGGAETWVKTYLNATRLAASGPYLFYAGTTDNLSSFTNIGAVDTTSGDDQVLITGSSANSRVLFADSEAFYFEANDAPGTRLVRVPLDSPQMVDVVRTGGVLSETTSFNGAFTTFASIDGVRGVWRVPAVVPAQRVRLLNESDLGTATQPDALITSGEVIYFVSKGVVSRAFAPTTR